MLLTKIIGVKSASTFSKSGLFGFGDSSDKNDNSSQNSANKSREQKSPRRTDTSNYTGAKDYRESVRKTYPDLFDKGYLKPTDNNLVGFDINHEKAEKNFTPIDDESGWKPNLNYFGKNLKYIINRPNEITRNYLNTGDESKSDISFYDRAKNFRQATKLYNSVVGRQKPHVISVIREKMKQSGRSRMNPSEMNDTANAIMFDQDRLGYIDISPERSDYNIGDAFLNTVENSRDFASNVVNSADDLTGNVGSNLLNTAGEGFAYWDKSVGAGSAFVRSLIQGNKDVKVNPRPVSRAIWQVPKTMHKGLSWLKDKSKGVPVLNTAVNMMAPNELPKMSETDYKKLNQQNPFHPIFGPYNNYPDYQKALKRSRGEWMGSFAEGSDYTNSLLATLGGGLGGRLIRTSGNPAVKSFANNVVDRWPTQIAAEVVAPGAASVNAFLPAKPGSGALRRALNQSWGMADTVLSGAELSDLRRRKNYKPPEMSYNKTLQTLEDAQRRINKTKTMNNDK